MIALDVARHPLRGDTIVPGDKSIGHRAIILASLAGGRSRIVGFSHAEDNRRTAQIFRDLGASIVVVAGHRTNELVVDGVGLHGLAAPAAVLDCGNSGTTARLLAGLLAAQPFSASLDGDASLRSRPMRRVIEPLTTMGAEFTASPGDRLPLTIRGASLRGIDHTLTVPSAQVKGALLLAGLYAQYETVVRTSRPSRDHTERMLRAVGATIAIEPSLVRVSPSVANLDATDFFIPGDLSSAALIAGAALLVPGSQIRIRGVGLNPTRTGVLDIWRAMGASIVVESLSTSGGEPTGDLVVSASDLKAVDVAGDLTLRAIDELPVVAVTAAFAFGTTTIRDASELRVKESDRIKSIVALLRAFGVRAEEFADGFAVEGGSALKAGAATSHGDHRIAMCAALLALQAPAGSTVDDAASVNTSFPDFFETLSRLQAAAIS